MLGNTSINCQLDYFNNKVHIIYILGIKLIRKQTMYEKNNQMAA